MRMPKSGSKLFPPAMSLQHSLLAKLQCQLGKEKYLKDQDSFLQNKTNGVNLELGSSKSIIDIII